jgi:hypothetical protein
MFYEYVYDFGKRHNVSIHPLEFLGLIDTSTRTDIKKLNIP